jgi:O-antigen/teichoic acid export membrane protein
MGTTLAQVLVSIKGLLIIPIVTKVAGTAVFGGYSLLVSALTLLVAVSSLGTWARLRRYLPSETNGARRAALFHPQLGFHLWFSLVLAAVAALVIAATPLRFLDGEFSLWLAALYVPALVLFFQLPNYFRYTNRVTSFNVSTVVVPYVFIGLVLASVALGFGISIDLLIALEVVAMIVVMLPLASVAVRELGVRVAPYRWPDLAADIRLGFPLIVAVVLDFALAASDRFLIGLFISVAAVGQYVPAYALGSFIVILAKIAGVVLPPLLSRLVDEGNEKEATVFVNVTLKAFLLAAPPFVVGAWVLSSDLLLLLANEEVAREAAGVTPIVALASVFYGLCLILDNVLFVRLKTAALFRASLIAVVLNVVLNLLLLPTVGSIFVAALSTLVGYVTMFAYVVRVASRHWPFAFAYWALAKSVAAAIAMGALLVVAQRWLGDDASAVWLLAEIGLGAAVYCGLALLFGAVSAEDRALLSEILRGRA